MKRPPPTLHILLWLVVLACGVVDLTATIAVQRFPWPSLPGVWGMGLAMGQVSLLAVWLVWGKWNIVWRIVHVALGTLVLSVLGASSTDGIDDTSKWYGILLLYVGMVTIVMSAARLMGYHFVIESAAAGTGKEDRPRRQWQFSIWSLLSAMTAVGLVLMLVRWVDLPRFSIEPIIFFLFLNASTCVIFFVSFQPNRILGAVCVAIVSPLAGVLMSTTGIPDPKEWLQLIMMNFVHGAFVYLVVTILRIGDLRLIRPAPELGSKGAQGAKNQVLKPAVPPGEP